jgi:hypothetical protein
MLVKYKIADEFAEQKISVVIPEVGLVKLDTENLTDEMAEASIEAGGKFFIEADVKAAKSVAVVAESKTIVESKNSTEDGKGK